MKRLLLIAALLAWCVPSQVPANDGPEKAEPPPEEKVQVVVTELSQVVEEQDKEAVKEETQEANTEDQLIETVNQ